jgi:hypothetical protein
MQEGPRQGGISTRQDREHEKAEAHRARQVDLRAMKVDYETSALGAESLKTPPILAQKPLCGIVEN